MPHSIHPAFYYRQTSPSGIFSPSSSSHLFDHHYSYMNYVAAAFSFVTPLVISPPPTSPTPPSTSPATLGAWSICSCYSWCLVYLLLLLLVPGLSAPAKPPSTQSLSTLPITPAWRPAARPIKLISERAGFAEQISAEGECANHSPSSS